MFTKKVAIYCWISRFESVPFTENGTMPTFGSYQQAQRFMDERNLNPNGVGGYSPVEIYVPI